MPAFPHLSEPEIGALTAYLKQLAGVPGAEREQVTLRVSRVRVGEHIAKSTCHICHSASGANPNPQQIMEGAIPPLSSLTARKDLSGFVGKVTEGAPVLMGTPPLLCRGRMPVFGYLSEDEAEDVYLYLTLHPPRTPTSATVSASLIPVGSTPPGGASPVNGAPPPGGAGQEDPQPISLMRFAVFPIVLFLFLGGVMARYLPLLAKVRRDDEIISIPLGAPVVGQATVPNVELRGEGAPAMRSSIDLDQAP
jgi:mono/diheme cytochrome c family protein